ncbi:MAG: Stp1/IreP family PP2C-type Ser/Thr phosphatase [Ferruginibacter sp.]
MFWRKKNKNEATQKSTEAVVENASPCNIKVVVKTDLGNVRTNNEDAGSFFKVAGENTIREKGYLLLVADGMGGHNAGEVASKMAVEIIHEEYFRPNGESNKEKLLSKAFNTANKKIFDMASVNQSYKGMGTTCTALVVVGQNIYYAHAGDSRAYLYKNKLITRLTEDHTYVQQLVNNGDITAAEADTHPQRNILTNAMGTKPTLRVDTGKAVATFDESDRLLLCSDGLYDYLTDDELAIALRYESLQDAADYLINEAKRRGGKDNITVVLAERTATPDETALKLTRDVDLPKLTRDADLPPGI